MKVIKILLKGFFFLAGLAAAGWIFMPWRQVGEGALLMAIRNLGAPATVAYSSVKNVPGGFTVENLEARKLIRMRNASMGDISLRSLTIVPDLTASLLNMAPTCQVAFTGEVLTPLKAVLGSGRVTVSIVSLDGRKILLDGLRSDGELSMDGSLFLDFSQGRPIQWAEVAIDVKSESLEEDFSSLQMLEVLPLEQDAQGRWRLHRTKGETL